MGLFENLGQGFRTQEPQQQVDPRKMQQELQQELVQIKANPVSFLKDKGYNVPGGMTDAGEITRFLLRTRQIGGNRLQGLMSMFGMAGR